MNPLTFENPSFIKYYGSGILYKDDYKIDVDFRYYLINEKGIVFCTSNIPLDLRHRLNLEKSIWRIEGVTEIGMLFRSKNLFITNFDGERNYQFIQQEDVIIGEISNDVCNDSATYSIYNLFNIEFEIEYSGFKIIAKSISFEEQKLISEYWQIPQFGTTIQIIKERTHHESYTTLINLIVELLSFATGKSLSFPLREFNKANKKIVMIGIARPTNKKIQPIIPRESIQKYLVETLPYFDNEAIKKYKEFRTLLEYINDTDIGYLDDRILSLIQVWEILANNWSEKYETTEAIRDLKKKIKPIIEEWHKMNPYYDKAMISQRVNDALIWDKTIIRLESLLDQFKFNRNVLEIDFKSLVNWRHKVAHEGMVKGADNRVLATKILNAQLAVRLLLLKKIGYSGIVVPNTGTGTQYPMNYYFKDL